MAIGYPKLNQLSGQGLVGDQPLMGNEETISTYTGPQPDPHILDDDSEFREFMLWLCGFTDAENAPSEESWKKLQQKTKEIAATYALMRRDRLKRKAQIQRQRASQMDEQMGSMGATISRAGQAYAGSAQQDAAINTQITAALRHSTNTAKSLK